MADVKWLHAEYRYQHEALEWIDGQDVGEGHTAALRADFGHYALERYRLGNTPESFESLYADFRQTEGWFRHYPDERPVYEWRRVDLAEFDSGGHRGGRVTMIKNSSGSDIFYEVLD